APFVTPNAPTSCYLKLIDGKFAIAFESINYSVDLKFYGLDGTLLDADAVIDGTGKAVGAKGKYILSAAFTVTIDGQEREIEFKSLFEIT
ncbi:MAG: hypothetical protein LBT20_08330, partial [Clostridiales bacterium]|nr:hypothetical protein [Clostridiales bacterium]